MWGGSNSHDHRGGMCSPVTVPGDCVGSTFYILWLSGVSLLVFFFVLAFHVYTSDISQVLMGKVHYDSPHAEVKASPYTVQYQRYEECICPAMRVPTKEPKLTISSAFAG